MLFVWIRITVVVNFILPRTRKDFVISSPSYIKIRWKYAGASDNQDQKGWSKRSRYLEALTLSDFISARKSILDEVLDIKKMLLDNIPNLTVAEKIEILLMLLMDQALLMRLKDFLNLLQLQVVNPKYGNGIRR